MLLRYNLNKVNVSDDHLKCSHKICTYLVFGGGQIQTIHYLEFIFVEMNASIYFSILWHNVFFEGSTKTSQALEVPERIRLEPPPHIDLGKPSKLKTG